LNVVESVPPLREGEGLYSNIYNFNVFSSLSCSPYILTFIMSAVFMVLWPNTMALGAVATGKAKAYEQTIPRSKEYYNNLKRKDKMSSS
jgi:hypothetical protein